MNKKIELIDFLKGFSIFTIVIGHYLSQLLLPQMEKNIVEMGGMGVHTFLLVSGFGLYLSQVRKNLNFSGFIKKRFAKIYLPYILIVTLTALLAFFIPVSENSLYAFFGHVFLYKMFDDSIMSSYGYQFWFISTIIQFYLIFCGLAWVKQRLSAGWFVALGLLISVVWITIVLLLGKEDKANWTRCCFQYIWEFMLGMVLAEWYARRNGLPQMKQISLLLVSVAGFGLFGLLTLKMGDIGKMLNDIPSLFGYTSLAIFIYQLGIKIVNRFFLFTGTISYALYLTHILVLSITLYILQIAGLPISLAAIAATLVVCYIASYLYAMFITKYL